MVGGVAWKCTKRNARKKGRPSKKAKTEGNMESRKSDIQQEYVETINISGQLYYIN